MKAERLKPPMQKYIEKLLYNDLSRHSMEKVRKSIVFLFTVMYFYLITHFQKRVIKCAFLINRFQKLKRNVTTGK